MDDAPVRTLSLDEAAEFLRTTPDTVSAMIRREGLPAAKVGRAWVLVDVDVIEWLRGRYPANEECDSTSENPAVPIGLPSTIAASRLDAALARPTGKRRKNTPTSSAQASGERTSLANVRPLRGMPQS